MKQDHTTLAFIGGGPRAVGLLERLVANAPRMAPNHRLSVLIFDPHPAGPGRIWRYAQSPSLKMNSLAEDVAMYNDPSCAIAGPHVPGPTLAEWVERVRSGEIAFTSPDSAVAAEIDRLAPQDFATRRLTSCYLRWFYEDVISRAPDTFSIREIRGRVDAVRDFGDCQILQFTDSEGRRSAIQADFVFYTVGHVDTEPTPFEEATAALAESFGLGYWPANFANETDFGTIPAGDTVLVRGIGLSFIDILVRLTIDRGGTQSFDAARPIGERATYRPSGDEPRLVVGSRRGVPYHSKITSHYHGVRPGMETTFLTRTKLRDLLDATPDTDFFTHIWPLIQKEMAFWYYREIFTGFPGRAPGDWERLTAIFHEESWGSERLEAAIAEAVFPHDRLDIDALDRPLAGMRFDSLASLQDELNAYIIRDLTLRELEEHSETLAIFWAILSSYVVIGDLLGHPNWSPESRSHVIPNWWHGFFSYVDSGPPAERLELVLALMRAGLLQFAGGECRIELDAARGQFVATSANHPDEIVANHLIEGFQPDRAIERSAEPVLLDLLATRQGFELRLGDKETSVATGKLAVDFERANLIRLDGSSHPRRFAVGDFTSGPPAGAFARPNTNARIFRENDTIARNLLNELTGIAIWADGEENHLASFGAWRSTNATEGSISA